MNMGVIRPALVQFHVHFMYYRDDLLS